MMAMSRILAPLKREMKTMIVRGLARLIDDEQVIQRLQVESFADDVRDNVENFGSYGFKSHPPVNSEVIMVNVGGNNEHSVAIASENREVLRSIPSLKEGDSIQYNKEGAYTLLKGANVEIKTEKLSIENNGNELISVLVEWIDQAIANRNITGIGPQPLFPVDLIAMQQIKTKLESFKL